MAKMAAVVIERSYRLGHLVICGRCRQLRGPWRDARNPQVYVQECACESDLCRREHADGDWEAERWPRFDFNQVAELCRCCGLEVLLSGSRWSMWFCEHCKDWVLDLNERAGACVIPIGRHSIMNQVALPATRAKEPAAVDEFVHAIASLSRGQDWIEEWAHRIVEINLTAVGLAPEEDVVLPEYLDLVRFHHLRKPAAVRAMFAAAGANGRADSA